MHCSTLPVKSTVRLSSTVVILQAVKPKVLRRLLDFMRRQAYRAAARASTKRHSPAIRPYWLSSPFSARLESLTQRARHCRSGRPPGSACPDTCPISMDLRNNLSTVERSAWGLRGETDCALPAPQGRPVCLTSSIMISWRSGDIGGRGREADCDRPAQNGLRGFLFDDARAIRS